MNSYDTFHCLSGPLQSPHNFRWNLPCLRISKIIFQNPEKSTFCSDLNYFLENCLVKRSFGKYKRSSNSMIHQFWAKWFSGKQPLVLQWTGLEGSSGKPWTLCSSLNCSFSCFHCGTFLIIRPTIITIRPMNNQTNETTIKQES